MKARIIIVTFVIAAIAAGGLWWQSQGSESSISPEFEATGTIEARDASLAFEAGGKVVEVLVGEGQSVSYGTLLVRLEQAQFTAQRAQALARLEAAKAQPGGVLLEIGRLDRLEMTVYVPEVHVGHVTPGQVVTVRVNTYQDRAFSGTVLRLADEAEFTPTNVQTKDDRVRLVYAATIGLDNPDLALKPGMIADVEF